MKMKLATVFLCSLVISAIAEDPEIKMNVSQIIQYWGYPAEVYDVTTEDGYILTLQRIPHGRSNKKTPHERPAVFLQHGLLGSSSQWITNLPNQSLAYALADLGYDVWLGNSRGNTYASKHVQLATNSEKFWDFTFDEFAKYDLPASLDFVLKCSRKTKVTYIGHSQGTTAAFAAFSTNQTLASKVNLFIALAPVAWVENMKSPIKYLSSSASWIQWFFGSRDFLPNYWTNFFGRYVCEEEFGSLWCSEFLFQICGHDKAQLNETRLPVYLAHTPAGTSVKDVGHFAQMYESGMFRKYDHGSSENLRRYGQKTPPSYDVTKIKVPIAMFSGGQDWLATPKDVSKLSDKLSSVVYHKYIPEWDHLDFLWGMDASTVINKRIALLLRKFNGKRSWKNKKNSH